MMETPRTVINACMEIDEEKAEHAHQCAQVLQILNRYPRLTTEEVNIYVKKMFKTKFLTDNRLDDLKEKGWITTTSDEPPRWYVIPIEETPTPTVNEPIKDYDVDETKQDQEADLVETEDY